MPLDCILLGTGGMMPMPYRLLTSLAVRLNGQIYLFDAGEGAQLAWKRLRLGVRGLKVIAVTHLHADHCLGIPGLMMLRAQMPDPSPLTVIGPPGIQEFLEKCREILAFHISYPVHYIEWRQDSSEIAHADDQVRIYWSPMEHTRFCLGYRLEELERPGRFMPDRAEAMGIPRGPLWGVLQRGDSVVSAAGEQIRPDQVLGSSRHGRKVCFVVDTRPNPGVLDLCRATDIAFIEGMFTSAYGEHADARGHMTVEEAARTAAQARVGKAVLVHISPRYGDEELPHLEEEARKHFRNVVVGRDLDIYPVQLRE